MFNDRGSHSFNYEQAVDAAVRILKEGGMDAIKLEGGSPSRITAAKAIVEAGIAVMGHVGLTPQAISVLGGFRAQGKNIASAVKVLIFPFIVQLGPQRKKHSWCCQDLSLKSTINRFDLYRLWRLQWLYRKLGVLLLFLNVCLHLWLLQQHQLFGSTPSA